MCLIFLRNKSPAIYFTHGIQTDRISSHSPPFHPRETDHLSHDCLVLFCVDIAEEPVKREEFTISHEHLLLILTWAQMKNTKVPPRFLQFLPSRPDRRKGI